MTDGSARKRAGALVLASLTVFSAVALASTAGVGAAAHSSTATVTAAGAPNCGGVSYPQNASGYYEVSTVDQLQCIGANHANASSRSDALAADYVLVGDVDAGTTDGWNGGKGFAPVGGPGSPFVGTFDGDGHAVSNLTIDRPGENYVGLFGQLGGTATVLDLDLDGANVTGDFEVGFLVGSVDGATVTGVDAGGTVDGTGTVGGIAGSLRTGTVEDASVTGSVNGSANVGGVVGFHNGTTRHSNASATVTGSGERVGGLVGTNKGTVTDSNATGSASAPRSVAGLVGFNVGTVTDSNATGTVEGDRNVGGLVGANLGTVNRSHATGFVDGRFDAGGLVGDNERGVIADSYATGNVNGSGSVGGLAGDNEVVIRDSHATGDVDGAALLGGLTGTNDPNATVTGSYATGNVDGADEVGGLVGVNLGTVTDSYATGAVTGFHDPSTRFDAGTGGLVGVNFDGTVNASYATGPVTGDTDVGGLVGNNTGSVNGSYAAGAVTGSSSVGGLVGRNDGSVSASYWDVDETGLSSSAGSPDANGLRTAEMKGAAATSNTSLDFADTWTVERGGPVSYPYLRDNPQTPPPGRQAVTANFSVVVADVNATVTAGETVVVEAEVENVGVGSGDQTVEFSVDGSPVAGRALSLAPLESSTETFTYATDGGDAPGIVVAVATANDSARRSVSVNRAPSAADDAYSTDEDQPLLVESADGVLANDDDPDGDSLTASVVSGPTDGTLSLDPDGSLTYTPDPEFAGQDTFTYQASDGDDTDTATVTITVDPVDDPPTARNDSYSTDEDTTLSVSAPGVLANDSDPEGDSLTAAVVSGPTNGTLLLQADGSLTYTPDPDFAGRDSFVYEVSDGDVTDTDTATVTVTVRRPFALSNVTATVDRAAGDVTLRYDVAGTTRVGTFYKIFPANPPEYRAEPGFFSGPTETGVPGTLTRTVPLEGGAVDAEGNGLREGERYVFEAYVRNRNGSGFETALSRFVTPSGPLAVELSGTAVNDSAVTLTANVTGFGGTDTAGSFFAYQEPGASDATFVGGPTWDRPDREKTTTIAGLAPGTTYRFTIVVNNGAGGTVRKTVTVTTDAAP